MSETSKFIFQGNEINLSHTIFDVTIWDDKMGRMIENPNVEEETKARLAKAKYLVEQGQVELVKPQENKSTNQPHQKK